MSSQDYNRAANLINENPNLADFVGGCNETLIKEAEEKLSLLFPQLYKNFLLKYGAGNFGSEEIYGIVKSDFDNSGIPDAIWFTLKQRREISLPSNLLIIYHTGGEEMFCLDFHRRSESLEPAVVSYLIGVEENHQIYNVIANDFGEFLLQRIYLELGMA
ncbi:MAG: SMI1/KNR4 family protein [Veillonellaceae bacterium]|uniref:SMI1/KNR4 family protein n=1 Tax=Anaerospora hongkongensis TaxID=244830 RepID=UPI00178F4D58|nr:SMI1/KNR4 family protein [Anaerospora hongkongensis]NLP40901.1 SMI1/KNR4 family protein [Veillonellaceae bacterium]